MKNNRSIKTNITSHNDTVTIEIPKELLAGVLVPDAKEKKYQIGVILRNIKVY
jgi:hypothetical protein